MTVPAYVPDTGDLIWTDFDPTKGGDQAGRRPALVISPKTFTEEHGARRRLSDNIARPFPTSVVLPPGFPVVGEVLVGHIRSIDTQARPVRHANATLPETAAQLVRAKLNTFITI
jgi:mRNA interferase MazF